MRILRSFLLSAFIVLYHGSFAQENPINTLDSISGQLIKNIRLKQTEQSFIVTDKSIYRTGESIWFRIFLLRSISQRMSAISKNLFVELINNNDSVLSTLLLNARNGQLNGKLYLGQSIPTGSYWIRAYTRYMAEEETNKISVQPIYVVNTVSSNDNSSRFIRKNNQDSVSIRFFPEGGSIITGANSTVAFYISDNDKEPVSLSGYVKDNHDSIIARLTSDKYGLGKFEFYPTRFRKYTAHLVWKEKDMAYPLPSFNFYAGQLSVIKQNNGERKIRVLLEDSIYRNNFRTYIIGISKDSLCFAGTGTGMYEVSVPEQKFPGGIATFYLLDEKLNFLSERSLYFRDNKLILKADLDKPIYKKRDNADLSILVTDTQNNPVPASLSITIIDSSLLQSENGYAIISNYFENGRQQPSDILPLANTDDLNDQQLDILMMGRADSYRSIMFKMNQPGFFSPDDDSLLYIRGKAVYTNKQPAAKEMVTLFSGSGNLIYGNDTITNNGKFVFPLVEYPDSTQFLIHISQHERAEQANILLDTLTFPKLAKLSLTKRKFTIRPAAVNNALRFYTDISSIAGDELSAVTVTAYKKKELTYDASKRVSGDSKIITRDEIKEGANGVSNAVLSVPGVQLINGFITIKGLSDFGIGPGTEPIVLLNGLQVFLSGSPEIGIVSPVLGYLNSLNTSEISFIEVLTGPEGQVYGMRGGHGVILINTKNSVEQQKTNNSSNAFLVRGYHSPPLFTMPDYDKSKIKAGKFKDLRSTLYWSAVSLTDQAGKIKIPFFTSDITANYKVIITGVTIHGDIIYKTLSFRTQ